MARDGRIGRTLGAKWRLEALLGAGGTSRVYAASHVETGERAAVKLLHAELSQRQGVTRLMVNEARVVAAIAHPGTVRTLDDGVTDDGCAFIVFELLTGQSLEELRQAHGGRVPLEEVMRIGDAAMDALAAVHQAGVLHRDIKPHNIYVLEGGGVKLLDFGFARRRGETADAAKSFFGTPSFMPPEQALGLSSKVDEQSDIWSLGATLFHVLSGQPVHLAKDMTAMMLASASARPRSLTDAAPELPRKIAAVVDRAIAYHKADRWPDMVSMRAAWQEAHPHWLPTLPPPSFDADPSFLDGALLAAVPGRPLARSLFDPGELLAEPPRRMKHPGALPTARGAAATAAAATAPAAATAAALPATVAATTESGRRDTRRGARLALAALAVLFVVLVLASARAVQSNGEPKTRSALPSPP